MKIVSLEYMHLFRKLKKRNLARAWAYQKIDLKNYDILFFFIDWFVLRRNKSTSDRTRKIDVKGGTKTGEEKGTRQTHKRQSFSNMELVLYILQSK